jgi:hypothetical protein
MIRKYNYTGRKKIFTKNIRITETITKNSKKFDFSCDFKGMEFPDEAKVFVEPYFKSTFKRFDFGSISRLNSPESLDISDLPSTDQIRYRIKVVDLATKNGLIIGYADVSGELINNENVGKQSILPVDFVDLGKRVWTLEFRSTGPVLAINEKLNNIRDIIRSNDFFFSLVYSEVIKRIAVEITSPSDFDEDELTGWQYEWIMFFRKVLLHLQPLKKDADDETKEEWCNDVADAFARKYFVFDKFNDQKL